MIPPHLSNDCGGIYVGSGQRRLQDRRAGHELPERNRRPLDNASVEHRDGVQVFPEETVQPLADVLFVVVGCTTTTTKRGGGGGGRGEGSAASAGFRGEPLHVPLRFRRTFATITVIITITFAITAANKNTHHHRCWWHKRGSLPL